MDIHVRVCRIFVVGDERPKRDLSRNIGAKTLSVPCLAEAQIYMKIFGPPKIAQLGTQMR